MAWKSLCEKHAYRRMSDDPNTNNRQSSSSQRVQTNESSRPYPFTSASALRNSSLAGSSGEPVRSRSLDRDTLTTTHSRQSRPKAMTYKSHFKQRYQVETAWRIGGVCEQRQITPDQGVVTSLHLTDRYIIVALDNAKIHIFDPQGRHLRCLQGHVMGVWAMVPWGDTLVSGGCDRDVRVWDMSTG